MIDVHWGHKKLVFLTFTGDIILDLITDIRYFIKIKHDTCTTGCLLTTILEWTGNFHLKATAFLQRKATILSVGTVYVKGSCFHTACRHDLTNNDACVYLWNETQAFRNRQEMSSCTRHFKKKNYISIKKRIMCGDQCEGQNINIEMIASCPLISFPSLERLDN